MERTLRVLAKRGRILVMAGIERRCELPAGSFFLRNATLLGYTVTGTSTQDYSRYARRLNAWLRKRNLRAKIDRVLRLSEAAVAHQQLEQGAKFGNIVLVPH
jgi:NADPH2:quinone reductase